MNATSEIVEQVCPECEFNPSVTCYESTIVTHPEGSTTRTCENCQTVY